MAHVWLKAKCEGPTGSDDYIIELECKLRGTIGGIFIHKDSPCLRFDRPITEPAPAKPVENAAEPTETPAPAPPPRRGGGRGRGKDDE